MGDETGSKQGTPDLSTGIPFSELRQDLPLLGHAGDAPVILVRRVDEFFAVGAHCTHYGGPLAEGLVVEGTVRCPWHHACFSLETGEALRAPALNPVACYDVEQADGRLRVGGKRPEPAPRPLSATAFDPPETVVIVGAGGAGNAAAEA